MQIKKHKRNFSRKTRNDLIEDRILQCERDIYKLKSQAFIGVDFNRHSPTTIIIVSRIDNGRVAILDTGISNRADLNNAISVIRQKYGIGYFSVIRDESRLLPF